MATAAVSPPSPKPEPPTPPDHLPRPSVSISGDSEALCKRAETSELLESKEFLIDPALLPTLESLLLELYAMLRPKPVDCEQRHTMIDVFNKIAKDIFGEVNGFPVVEPFGSFTMDLFTAKSDLDLSVNFSSDMDGQFPRKEKISVIRKFAKVLHKHQCKHRVEKIFFISLVAFLCVNLSSLNTPSLIVIPYLQSYVLELMDLNKGTRLDWHNNCKYSISTGHKI